MPYNWKDIWISKYESVWCTIEKFKYSNELTDGDIRKLLEGNIKHNNILNVFEGFDSKNCYIVPELINKLLEKDILLKKTKEIKELLGRLSNDSNINKYEYKNFRYCPLCIKKGYHSWLHQLNFLDTCIFHNIKLHTKCPSCKKEHYHKINSGNTGFSCDCGYNYLHKTSFKELMNIWENEINEYNNIKTLDINTDNNFSYLFSSFEFNKNIYIDRNKEYYINLINLDKVLDIHNKKDNNIIKFKPIFYKCSVPSYSENNLLYCSLGYFMMDEYISIYKSIARNIRKKINRKGFKFIFKNRIFILSDFISKYDILYKDIQDELYAYIMWRKEVEGLEIYCDVHSKKIINRTYMNTNELLRYNIANTPIYQSVYYEWKDYVNKYRNHKIAPFYDYGILKSSLERIISKILMKYFNDWLEYIKNKKVKHSNEKADFKTIIPIKFNDIMIIYDNKDDIGYLTDL